jgi:serine/threonine-protein kinase PRP4
VFSCVVKATDTLSPSNMQVAIKIIRMFDIMRESGEKEREIVNRLNKADPSDSRNIVRLHETFEYNGHLCLVYECLEMNLRETLHKFGRHVGLSLDGVCLYGR